MISIFQSTSQRATSTTQDLLDDLKATWNGWSSVTYNTDGDPTSGVSQLNLTSEIYLSSDGASTSKLKITHDTTQQSVTFSAVLTSYKIIVTDKGLMLVGGVSGGIGLVIGSTTDLSGAASKGLVARHTSANSNHTIFTDHMTTGTASMTVTSNAVRTGSAALTQLVPVCSFMGDEVFDGVYFVFIGKSSDDGAISLGGKTYYLNNTTSSAMAIEYT